MSPAVVGTQGRTSVGVAVGVDCRDDQQRVVNHRCAGRQRHPDGDVHGLTAGAAVERVAMTSPMCTGGANAADIGGDAVLAGPLVAHVYGPVHPFHDPAAVRVAAPADVGGSG